jgi:hypothetical protein
MMKAFAAATGDLRLRSAAATGVASDMAAINVIGDPCINGTYVPGCPGLQQPNMSSLQPILDQAGAEGIFFYTFGSGYSGWSGTEWGQRASPSEQRKPVIGARVSLWGEATTGTMLGVDALVSRFEDLLKAGKITSDSTRADGYSLVPVHAWSHNVSDVVRAAELLATKGAFEIITPTTLMREVAANVKPYGAEH